VLAVTEDAGGGAAEVLARFGTDPSSVRRQVMLRMQAERKLVLCARR